MTLRVAVVGTGSIGLRHLHLLQAMDGIEPVAVPVRPDRVRCLHDLGFQCSSLDEFDSRAVDAAIIATETDRHVTDLLRITSSIPVLVEKPLSFDAHHASGVLGHPAPVNVAMVLRFDAGLLWARERLPLLGRIRWIDVECLSWLPNWRPERSPADSYSARTGTGGVLLDLIHEIDYVTWMFGSTKSLAATIWNSGTLPIEAGVEDSASIVAVLGESARASLRLSFADPRTARRLEVTGEHGVLEVDLVTRVATCTTDSGHDEFSWVDSDMYASQLEGWLAGTLGRAGTTDSKSLCSTGEAIDALKVVDAVRHASAERQWVDL